MPWRPDFSQHRRDPRFDRYRDRVGGLLRGTEEVGFVLVEVEPMATQTGGHWWWRRWAPSRDVLWPSMIVDGQFLDPFVADGEVDAELRDYDSGRFRHCGEELGVRWADAEESRLLSRKHFDR